MGPGTPVNFSFHSKCSNQRSAIWALRAVLGGLPLRRGDPNRYSKISRESRIQRSHQRLPEGLRGERCLYLNSPPGARPKPAYRARPAKPSFLLTLLELIPQQETRCHNTEKSPVRGHPRFHSFTRALSLHWFPITSWPPLPTPLIPTGGGHPST